MVDVKLLSLAMDLRANAREMLSRAETIYDLDTEQRMRAVAACYEKSAQRLEHVSVGEHLQSDHAAVRLGPGHSFRRRWDRQPSVDPALGP
jgi:hypothetical protein